MIRYGILALNVVVLSIVVLFVLKSPDNAKIAKQSANSSNSSETITNPLDQLSSADIAANVAQITRLSEAVAVTNQADSVNALLSVAPVDDKLTTKPQIVNNTTKTRKDIKKYTVVAGDTVSSLATKFGVTSESIRWSNGIGGNSSLTTGKELWISPISDGIVYLVKAGDTAQSLANSYRANKDSIISFNDAELGGLPVGERIVIPGGTQQNVFQGGDFSWLGGSAIYSNNAYAFGWCTWYVANRRSELGRPVPSNLGNANTWYIRAAGLGVPTGSAPAVGAVVVEANINHVSVVEQINADGSFVVSEMNYRGWNVKTSRTIVSTGGIKFIY